MRLFRAGRSIAAAGLPALGLLIVAGARADEIPPNPAFGERVEFIRNDKLFPVNLQITVFQPEGAGPFPVVVLNHGKDGGNGHLQPRNRAMNATREFLQRGYAVVAPMRQGFAGSGGSPVGEGCNIAGNGEAQAEDLVTVVRWLGTQPWADTSRMVMMGQSHGGLATMAYAQAPHPGFKLFVNFAGGLRYLVGCQWELALKDAMGSYGRNSRIPSVWFYGANDSYFPPQVIGPAFAAFTAAGGPGEMVAYPAFGVDAHGMFGSADGLDIWRDKVLARMREVGLPTEVVAPQYGRTPNAPAASEYAAVDDVEALKRANAGAEASYRRFLAKRLPRAFVMAPKIGKQYYVWGGENPLTAALAGCEKMHHEACVPYAVDDVVVWRQP